MIQDLNKKETIEVNGGGERYAYYFGRAVGLAVGFPFSGIYYAGKDLDLW
ncbi:hypothetical protein Murru_3089 [Allomuricauda ruestringensis DSM 13258]|uniref:Uncharacterized protein n=1 Tax=Allomuricauda ruestringensis (strain DSM 13258 / CIP 107369 / LMG 19739 / B1) TaxID=886377 RepID=G2PKR4_ALLRU|nr:hypothetical protein [Allomuricauda ruestringensis]AEM72110.1 hypothetical protein Murru_3089 [Allomuricauda ruestringensis DSM 13258]